MGIAVDRYGNVYVADSYNNRIRKITPSGAVSTFAGNGTVGAADGRGMTASFFYPEGVATDSNGNVYVADTHNNLIRKITPEGTVTTIAGKRTWGDSSVWLDNPQGIAVDVSGGILVADWGNDLIRRIAPNGLITTVAGSGKPGAADGSARNASFYLPEGLAVDAAGNIYVADTYNNMIRRIGTDGGVTTLAGNMKKGSLDGRGPSASFLHPAGIAVDRDGNLYIADVGNNKVRRLSPAGIVSTVAGTGKRGAADGNQATASFYKPYGLALGLHGEVYVADYQNNLVRVIDIR